MAEGWRLFLERYQPLRPTLYRYCRHLTGEPWDAEDLVQDTLARAFASLASLSQPPESARAWLFRVASNLWIDEMRRRVRRERREALAAEAASTAIEATPRDTREALGTLVVQLAPQERAAVQGRDTAHRDCTVGHAVWKPVHGCTRGWRGRTAHTSRASQECFASAGSAGAGHAQGGSPVAFVVRAPRRRIRPRATVSLLQSFLQ